MNLIIPNIDRETFDTLYNSIKSNINRYRSGDENWIYDFWRDKGYTVTPSRLDIKLLRLDPQSEETDVAVALYEGLGISPMIASSGMFWTIYSHYELPYLLKKWSLTGNDDEDTMTIRSHYFCSWDENRRELGRKALPRLWWIVHLTVDDSRTDRYELTREALMQASTVMEILERPGTTMNRKVTNRLLNYSLKQREQGTPLLREEFRKLTNHLNALSQTIRIDALDEKELDDEIKSFIHWSRNYRPQP